MHISITVIEYTVYTVLFCTMYPYLLYTAKRRHSTVQGNKYGRQYLYIQYVYVGTVLPRRRSTTFS